MNPLRTAMAPVLVAAALAYVADPEAAQSFPSKPIRLIVPFPPGGGTDFSARILAQAMAEGPGWQIVVENRPGATGRIGTEIAAKAPPDGYTLLLGTAGPNAILPAAYPKLPYDALADFTPVTLVDSAAYVLVVHPSLPVRAVRDLIAIARTKPAQITFASAGNLSVGHMAGELRAIASTGTRRSRVFPELPTVADTLPGYAIAQWVGVLAPAGTPRDIVSVVHGTMAKVLQSDKVTEQFTRAGSERIASSPEEFSAHIKAEIAKWRTVLKNSGVARE